MVEEIEEIMEEEYTSFEHLSNDLKLGLEQTVNAILRRAQCDCNLKSIYVDFNYSPSVQDLIISTFKNGNGVWDTGHSPDERALSYVKVLFLQEDIELLDMMPAIFEFTRYLLDGTPLEMMHSNYITNSGDNERPDRPGIHTGFYVERK